MVCDVSGTITEASEASETCLEGWNWPVEESLVVRPRNRVAIPLFVHPYTTSRRDLAGEEGTYLEWAVAQA